MRMKITIERSEAEEILRQHIKRTIPQCDGKIIDVSFASYGEISISISEPEPNDPAVELI